MGAGRDGGPAKLPGRPAAAVSQLRRIRQRQGAEPAAAASPGGRPAPKAQIYEPGKAPVYKPLTRRLVSWRVLPWTLTILVFPIVSALARSSGVPTATLQSKYSVTLLTRDQGSRLVYAVLGGHLIQQVDFAHPTSHPPAQVRDYVTDLVVKGTSAYFASRYAGQVGRVDLRTRRVLWVRSVGVGIRSLVLADGRVVVASPAGGTVEELAAADGKVIARRAISGTPYGVAAADGHLYVILARTSQVAELDPRTLVTMATIKVPAGPREIIAQGARVWVRCELAHRLVALSAGPAGSPALAGSAPVASLWMSTQQPGTSSAGGWFSIEGQEWVTVVSPGGLITRVLLEEPDIISMVVQADGSVIVGYDSGEIDKVEPLK